MSFGELSASQFFIIFAAIIFGGQSAGIMFGFTSSKLDYVLHTLFHIVSHASYRHN
jgi:hypothetical protein